MEAQRPDKQFTFVQCDEAGRLFGSGFRPSANGTDTALTATPAKIGTLAKGALLRLTPIGAVAVRIGYVDVNASAPAGGSAGLLIPAAAVQYWTAPADCDLYAWAASATSVNVTAG